MWPKYPSRTDAPTKTGPLFTTYSLKSSGGALFCTKNFRPLCFLLFRQECSLNPPPYFLTLVAKLRKIWFWCTTLALEMWSKMPKCRYQSTNFDTIWALVITFPNPGAKLIGNGSKLWLLFSINIGAENVAKIQVAMYPNKNSST